jgi:predicted acylesterase/phospholipase RssA
MPELKSITYFLIKTMNKTPECFVFKGGGIKILCYAGVVRYYEEIDFIKDIKVCVGSSGGALAAAMIILGYSSGEMLDEFNQVDTNVLFGGKITSIPNLPRMMYNSWKTYGITDGTKYTEQLKFCIAKKTNNPDITFEELHNLTGKTLLITGTCLNTHKTEIFSHFTTPKFPVYKALRITTSLPPVLAPVIIKIDRHYLYAEGPCTQDGEGPMSYLVEDWLDDNDELLCRLDSLTDELSEIDQFEKWYIDGGLLCNYPIEQACQCLGDRNRVVGFDIDTSSDPKKRDQQFNHIGGMWDYIKNTIFAQYSELERIVRKCDDYWDITIPLVVKNIDIYEFNITSAQIQQLYNDGYQSVKRYYESESVMDHDEKQEVIFNIKYVGR